MILYFNYFLIISLLLPVRELIAAREFKIRGVRTILATHNETIKIECDSDQPMTYCAFVHPSGKRFSFSGPALVDGHCSISRTATLAEAGDWLCHISTAAVGLELVQRIHVRVVDKVAAIEPNKTVTHGSEITLRCATTHARHPISYCRFEPPFGTPFGIDMAVTRDNPILKKYYYPKNMSLDRGDCAVTIKKVKYTDVGEWTCGVGLDDGQEYTDTLYVMVEGFYTMTTASVAGLTFGSISIVLLLAFLGILAWKKRHMLGSTTNSDEVEMEHVPKGHRSPKTPEKSPRPSRIIVPTIVIQSPSEPSTSSPLVD